MGELLDRVRLRFESFVVERKGREVAYLWTAYVGAATHVVTRDAEVLAVKHFHRAQVVEPAAFLRQLRAPAG